MQIADGTRSVGSTGKRGTQAQSKKKGEYKANAAKEDSFVVPFYLGIETI